MVGNAINDAPGRLAQRNPTPAGNVVSLFEYRIKQCACSSAKPHAFVHGYVVSRSEGELLTRQIDQLIDRGLAALARYRR